MLLTLLSGLVGLIPVLAFLIHGSRVLSKILHESQIKEFVEKLSLSSYRLIDHLSVLYGFDNEVIRTRFAALVIHTGHAFSEGFNTFVSETPTLLMMGLISILSAHCFLRESDRIRALFDRYFYFNKTNGNKFVQLLKVCCREVFFSNIITGLIQASIVSAGALFFGVGDFFLIFFVTFVFSYIPIIGAAPVAILIGVICFMEARFGAGISMMAIAVVAGISDNIIRPLLGSLGEVKVQPFIGLLAVIGGVIMFGLPGLFIGPLVVSVSFGALPIIVDEYFPIVISEVDAN